nr:RagB/SusD family nutrient uptake outer membrane protein [uncultured Carboxylicivirga sp.]
MKIHYIINRILAILIILIIGISSCTDLNEKPFSVIPDRGYTFSDEEIKSLNGDVYENLRLLYWGWNGTFDIYEESSDLIMTPLRLGVGWGDLYVTMHKHTYTATTGHFWTIWDQAYKTITGCNQLLEYDIVKDAPASAAELRGIRGLSYYLLLDNFRNVPLDTTFTREAGFLPEQEDPQKLFNFIENEMKDIKSILKDQDILYGQFNYYAACMVLAKLYLNYNAWFGTNDNSYYEKAYKEVSEVINDGKFTLSSSYTEPFMSDGSTCSEIIYGIVFSKQYNATGNYLSNKCLHGGSKATFNLKSAPWNGSCAVPQFIDTYDPDDSRFNDTWLMGQQKDKSGADITIDGTPLIYTQSVHSIDDPGAYQMEGARFHKYEIVSGEDGTYGDDVPFFRLTDAYMIKAECLLRLGGYNDETEQTAADIVTMIRERAFKSNPAKATRTVAQLKGPSVYNYGHQENKGKEGEDDNWITTEEGGDDVELGGFLDDLAWEFVGEHHRRQDLIRFKLTNGNNVYTGKSRFCFDADNNPQKNIFPLPQDFLDANSKLVQNPGY